MESRKREYLIDIQPSLDGKNALIYNLSAFFAGASWRGKQQYLERVNHTIIGENNTINIIDDWNILDEQQAERLARNWYAGDYDNYRLD